MNTFCVCQIMKLKRFLRNEVMSLVATKHCQESRAIYLTGSDLR